MQRRAETTRARDLAAILFASVLPSAITFVYFVLLARSAAGLQQTAYLGGKTLQFAFPLVWVLLVQRERLSFTKPDRSGIFLSLVFGLLVTAGMVALYTVWLGKTAIFAGAAAEVKAKVSGFGVSTATEYLAMGIFYSVCHAFLEEYYYRWFIYGQLRKYYFISPAVLFSSLAFMAHHVIVLGMYFGFTSVTTILFSLAIAIGGAVWALLYERSRSLVGPWLSHLLVDAGIFLVGYQMVSEQLR